jgi:hypothetical protein
MGTLKAGDISKKYLRMAQEEVNLVFADREFDEDEAVRIVGKLITDQICKARLVLQTHSGEDLFTIFVGYVRPGDEITVIVPDEKKFYLQ